MRGLLEKYPTFGREKETGLISLYQLGVVAACRLV